MKWDQAIDKIVDGFLYGSGFVIGITCWIGLIARAAKYFGTNV